MLDGGTTSGRSRWTSATSDNWRLIPMEICENRTVDACHSPVIVADTDDDRGPRPGA
jgi:hypothetical protein